MLKLPLLKLKICKDAKGLGRVFFHPFRPCWPCWRLGGGRPMVLLLHLFKPGILFPNVFAGSWSRGVIAVGFILFPCLCHRGFHGFWWCLVYFTVWVCSGWWPFLYTFVVGVERQKMLAIRPGHQAKSLPRSWSLRIWSLPRKILNLNVVVGSPEAVLWLRLCWAPVFDSFWNLGCRHRRGWGWFVRVGDAFECSRGNYWGQGIQDQCLAVIFCGPFALVTPHSTTLEHWIQIQMLQRWSKPTQRTKWQNRKY